MQNQFQRKESFPTATPGGKGREKMLVILGADLERQKRANTVKMSN
jgi:hypothetical protein